MTAAEREVVEAAIEWRIARTECLRGAVTGTMYERLANAEGHLQSRAVTLEKERADG